MGLPDGIGCFLFVVILSFFMLIGFFGAAVPFAEYFDVCRVEVGEGFFLATEPVYGLTFSLCELLHLFCVGRFACGDNCGKGGYL